MRVGLIADTHGLLRPAVHDLFSGVDLILHAGDVGGEGEDVLRELELLAPVTAVYGNVDTGLLRRRLPQLAEVEVDGLAVVVTHGDQLALRTPDALKEAFPRADVVVFGHTHRALIHNFPDFSVVVNPGAAGVSRFDSKPSVAIMETEAGIPPRLRIVPLR
jgi:putative phosphoesterase